MAPRLRASRSQLQRNWRPGAAAAMQRHDQRPGAIGRIVSPAHRARTRPVPLSPNCMTPVPSWAGSAEQTRLLQALIRTQRGIEKEPVHRREDAGERIERLRAPSAAACSARYTLANHRRLFFKVSRKPGKGREDRIAGRIERRAYSRTDARGHSARRARAAFSSSSGVPTLAMSSVEVGGWTGARRTRASPTHAATGRAGRGWPCLRSRWSRYRDPVT